MRIKDLLEAIEKDPSDLATIQSNVYGTESGYGKADTSKPNYAGAMGPMQIMPGTFDWMKTKGIIPKEYDISNPEQNKAAGDALLGHYHQKYGGDPAKVYAAYYGGPGAVNKDGSINTHWRDLKNPNAPTVGQYIEKAMAKSGGNSTSFASSIKNAPADVKNYIATNFPSVNSFIDTVTNKANDMFNTADAGEVELVINGKKVKFKNKKEAMLAMAKAKEQGDDVQNA